MINLIHQYNRHISESSNNGIRSKYSNNGNNGNNNLIQNPKKIRRNYNNQKKMKIEYNITEYNNSHQPKLSLSTPLKRKKSNNEIEPLLLTPHKKYKTLPPSRFNITTSTPATILNINKFLVDFNDFISKLNDKLKNIKDDYFSYEAIGKLKKNKHSDKMFIIEIYKKDKISKKKREIGHFTYHDGNSKTPDRALHYIPLEDRFGNYRKNIKYPLYMKIKGNDCIFYFDYELMIERMESYNTFDVCIIIVEVFTSKCWSYLK